MSEGLCRPGCRYNARARWTNYSLKQNCTSFWVSLYSSPYLDPVLACPSQRTPKVIFVLPGVSNNIAFTACSPLTLTMNAEVTTSLPFMQLKHECICHKQKCKNPQSQFNFLSVQEYFPTGSVSPHSAFASAMALEKFFRWSSSTFSCARKISVNNVCPTGKERPQEVWLQSGGPNQSSPWSGSDSQQSWVRELWSWEYARVEG